MSRDKLLRADLLSEIILLGTGVAIVVALLMVVAAASSAAVFQ